MTENAAGTGKRKVGLFDIRIIIGSLIGLYGIILVLTGLLSSDAQANKASGLNINVLAGISMIVLSAGFVVWARWRPIVVPDDPVVKDEAQPPAH